MQSKTSRTGQPAIPAKLSEEYELPHQKAHPYPFLACPPLHQKNTLKRGCFFVSLVSSRELIGDLKGEGYTDS